MKLAKGFDELLVLASVDVVVGGSGWFFAFFLKNAISSENSGHFSRLQKGKGLDTSTELCAVITGSAEDEEAGRLEAVACEEEEGVEEERRKNEEK